MSRPHIDGIDVAAPSDEKGEYALYNEKDIDGKSGYENLEQPPTAGKRCSSNILPEKGEHALVQREEGYALYDDKDVEGEAGYGNLDQPPSVDQSEGSSFTDLSEEGKEKLVQGIYMAIFAVIGTTLRIIIAQLFGEECANPGTVGWLAASSPLCVTADGSTEREGGIIFADLPSNILGSFLMGMMQTTTALSLPVVVPIAWLSLGSWFQGWDIIHLAIRTGLCGSLTTFSSWNSEMVVMIIGTGDPYTTQIIRALFGYIIGMEVSLGSYVMGRKVAEWAFRSTNPSDWEEAEAIVEKKEEGVYINRELPEFERRFLPNLDMPSLGEDMESERLELLAKWRVSTEEARRVGHRDLEMLKGIEKTVLVDREQVSHNQEVFAQDAGWELESLTKWAQKSVPSPEKPIPNDHFLFKPAVAITIIALLYTFLFVALFSIETVSAYLVTYRTMVYAAMWAPPGALLRWHLSGWNGQLPGNLSWFPAGTWAANVFGCMVSITCIVLEYVSPVKGFWKIGTLRAVKVGFSGCLTTVSTFVSEVHGFSQTPHRSDRAYAYIMCTLLPCCFLSLTIFAAISFAKGY